MLGVRKDAIQQKYLFTRSALSFCLVCRLRGYDLCYTDQTPPRLVPTFKKGIVKEMVSMDTGVDLKTVDPNRGVYNGQETAYNSLVCSVAERKSQS